MTDMGGIAILWSTASVALLVILATSIVLAHNGSYTLIAISATVQIISYLGLIVLFATQCRLARRSTHRSRAFTIDPRYLLILISGVLPVAVATILVGATLGLIYPTIIGQRALPVLGRNTHAFLNITCIVWGITILIHVGYLACSLNCSLGRLGSLSLRMLTNDNPREMIEPGQPPAETTVQSSPFREPAASLPSLTRSDGESSRRSSLSRLKRPRSIKKNLIRHSLTRASRRMSTETPSSRPSQDEDFDSWETSAVSSQIREAIFKFKPGVKASGLEPIPGSRSPSPATALEGPFTQTCPDDSPLPQPPISKPTSLPSRRPEHPDLAVLFPPAVAARTLDSQLRGSFSKANLPSRPVSSRSRASTCAQSCSINPKDLIHPLFRAGSPTPAPSPSIGSVVHAAPEAGQILSESMLKKMRSGSMPSISSPLLRSESVPDFRLTKLKPFAMETPSVPPKSERRSILHHRKRSASCESGIQGLVTMRGGL